MSKLQQLLQSIQQHGTRYAVGFSLLRLAVVGLLILGIPALDSHVGYYFHHGGDQLYYYEFAEKIAAGDFSELFSIQVGFPALLAMAIKLSMASDYVTILPITVPVMGAALGSLSVLAVYVMGKELTKNNLIALASCAIWALLPLIFWGLILVHPNARILQMVNVPLFAWLVILPDGMTIFCGITGVYFAARYANTKSIIALIGCAISCALIALFRIQQVPVIAVIFGAIVMTWRLRAIVVWLTTFFATYYVQIFYVSVYKVVALQFAHFLTWLPTNFYFGYVTIWENPEGTQIKFVELHNPISIEKLGALLQPTYLIVITIGALVGIFILRYFIQRLGLPNTVLLLFSGIAMVILVLASSVFEHNTIRYSIPAVPFLLVLGFWVLKEVLQLFAKLPVFQRSTSQ